MQVNNQIVKNLLQKYEEISLLDKIKATLDWDLNVNLAPLGSEFRAKQSSYLTQLTTDKWRSDEFRNLLEKANNQTDLNEEEKAIIRNFNDATKYYYNIPQELIIKREELTSKAFLVWRQAKEENNFKLFLPFLKEIVEVNQQTAKYLGYGDNPYDSLLDLFEPGLTAKDCQVLFEGLKPELLNLVKEITKTKKEQKFKFMEENKYDVRKQEELSRLIVSKMGFDFKSGHISVSAHPFTTALSRHDIRFTTHYNVNDFREAFTSSMHEAGHALYEQGINEAYSETPLQGGVSFGVHEAMSRFWENMVGKNPQFLEYILPTLKNIYPEQLKNISAKEIILSFNDVAPSLVRIYADEVTYSLHIILRFEMENLLINGKIKAEDAAQVWREKSKELFGIEPKTDSEGVLQDVHWAYGSFGYFPSYLLGNLYGSQILSVMKTEMDFDKNLSEGNLLPIKDWLDKNVHQYGSLYYPKDLIKKISGEKLDYKYFIKYLTEKFSKIYNF